MDNQWQHDLFEPIFLEIAFEIPKSAKKQEKLGNTPRLLTLKEKSQKTTRRSSLDTKTSTNNLTFSVYEEQNTIFLDESFMSPEIPVINPRNRDSSRVLTPINSNSRLNFLELDSPMLVGITPENDSLRRSSFNQSALQVRNLIDLINEQNESILNDSMN